jgi:hypothetical protein
MSQRHLEITFRRGKPLAAYLYLPRRADDRSARVEELAPGYLVDRAADGRPIGIELASPGRVTLEDLNRVLAALGLVPLTAEDAAPLVAA